MRPAADEGILALLHLSYVKRWVIAPTHREQSVAEHTFRVLAIAIHLTAELQMDSDVRMNKVVRLAIWHDAEERLTGDVPGPQKSKEAGYLKNPGTMSTEEIIVKVADSIETGTFWVQWGNKGAWYGHPSDCAPGRDITKIEHYAPAVPGLLEAAKRTWRDITGEVW